MTKLSIEDDQGHKTEVVLVRDEYSLGRADGNAVRLTERNISRSHARFIRNGAGWVVEDLSSYNGCFVNGERVRERVRLDDGDLLQLGDYRLSLVAEASEGTDSDSKDTWRRSRSLIDQPDRLVMVVGPKPGREFPLRDGLLIGRGDECDVSINHASVSRIHAEIRGLGDGRFEIVDKNSANGVRLNGVELERALIDARDNIELGDVVLRFIPAGQIYRPGEEAQRLGPSDTPVESVAVGQRERGQGLSLGTKAMVAVAALAVAALATVWLSRGSESTAVPATSEPDRAARLLEQANRLLKAGNVEAAHEQVLEIPEGSNARKSAPFRMIEAEWADRLFELASDAEGSNKRALLDRIARTPTVDAIRRKRAAQELAALTAESVDVDDLPSAPREQPGRSAEPSPAAPGREKSSASSKNRVPAAKPASPRTKPPPRSAATNATLVRDSPF